MTRVCFLPGVALASGLIGAIVATGGLATALANDGDPGLTFASAPFVIMLAVPVGFAVSILPNFAGAALLAWAGRGNIGARLPIVWALVGAGGGGALAVALGGVSTPPVTTLAAIGAVSALLCRWKTTWNDDIVMKEASHEQERPRPARAVARPGRHAADRWLD